MRDPVRPRLRAVPGRVFRGLRTRNVFEAASSIAFRFFLGLIPFLALVGFVVEQLVRRRGVEALAEPFLAFLPPTSESVLFAELDRIGRGHHATLAPVSAAATLWLGSSGVHNLMDVFETTRGAARRRWWKQRLIALGWVLSALALFVATAWTIVKLDGPARAAVRAGLGGGGPSAGSAATASASAGGGTSGNVSGRGGPGGTANTDAGATASANSAGSTNPSGTGATTTSNAAGAAGANAPAVASTTGRVDHRRARRRAVYRAALQTRRTPAQKFALVGLLSVAAVIWLAGFYRFAIVHPRGTRPRVWPGAMVGVAGALLVSWAFGLYVTSLAHYALYYGSLAAVAVLMVWLFLTALALLLGAEVNAQLEATPDDLPEA